MDILALIAIAAVIGFCIYKSGKKIGSRKGYAAGRPVSDAVVADTAVSLSNLFCQ